METLTKAKEGADLFQFGYSVVNAVSDLLDAYNDRDLAEIEQIQDAYKEHCLPNEKKSLHLSTLKDGTQTLPLHFRMDTKKKVPLLFFDTEFCPQKTLHHWVSSLSPNLISNFIEDMLGYICEYQARRDGRGTLQKGYDYDPTNLFLEEFKEWLVELSKASVETDLGVIAVIEGRIEYLSYLISYRVFIPGKYLPTREIIVSHLRDILAKNIQPVVELAQLRQSARDHFKLMKLNVQRLVKQGTEFLFYVFRNSLDTPINFIMGQIRCPTLPSYQAILSDRSGSLLQYLLNTPAVKLVHPELHPFSGEKRLSQELVNVTTQSLTSNHFLDDENRLIYSFNMQDVCINNWYQEDKNNPVGILTFFQNETYMMAFLRMHQHLEKLSVFYLICSLIFDLASEGGNLLVYRCAMKDVKAIIDHYQHFINAFKENVALLWGASEKLQSLIVEKKIDETDEIKQWRLHKGLSSSSRKEIKKLIEESHDIAKKIKDKIIEINTDDHLELIQKQTEFLSELASIFCKRSVISSKSEPAQLEAKPNLPLSVQVENKEEEDPLEKVVVFYNIASTAYNAGNYLASEATATQLLTGCYQQTSLPFRNDLLILRYQCRLNLGDFKGALNDMNQLLEDEPDNIECRFNKACLLHHLNLLKEAKDEIEEILKLDSTHQKAIRVKQEIDKSIDSIAITPETPKKFSYELSWYGHKPR